MRGDGVTPSSTGRALLQTVCVHGAPGVPTVRLKARAQLPWVESTASANGTTVPQATFGATQTPKWGAIETTVAGASLVFGGVLERHPGLKVCLSHGGGFLPYQAGRFRHGFAVRPEAKVSLAHGPQESIGRLFYDTILHDKRTLEFLISSAGPHHVLLGSDYPFDMGNLDCVARVAALALPPDVRDTVLGKRAGALLRHAAA